VRRRGSWLPLGRKNWGSSRLPRLEICARVLERAARQEPAFPVSPFIFPWSFISCRSICPRFEPEKSSTGTSHKRKMG
jgi:hypothetical protein